MDDPSYYHVPKDGKILDLLEKTRVKREKREEEERLVGDLQKHAKHAKERRRAKTSTGSSTVSTPSDDEDKGASFHGVRRRSKDSGQPTILEQPTVAIQKTENTIFGSAHFETDNSRLISNEDEFKGRRRASSLQKLLENKFYDSAISINSHSNSEHSTLQRVSEEVSPAADDKPVTRPNNLDLDAEEHSESASYDDKFSPTLSSDVLKTCDNLMKQDLILSEPRLSPTTPDKRSSGFSEEEDSFSNSENNTTPKSHSKSEDYTTTDKTNLEHSLSTPSTISSSFIQTPSLDRFNASEEYDKIAKELSEEETSPKRNKARPISENSSTISVDSGFRNSLEVPHGRHASMDAWSDFEENSSDEEESIPDSSSRRPSEVVPSPTVSVSHKLDILLPFFD